MRSIAYFLLFLFVSFPTLAEDRCKAILANGVWDYQIGMNETQYVSSFLNWYGSSASSKAGSNKRASLTGSGVYEGAPISLGLSSDDQQNQEFMSRLEKLNSGYEQYDSATVNFVKTASAIIVKAWSDCIGNSSQTGVRASLRFSGDPRDLIVDLRFQPINEIAVAKVRVSPPTGTSCDRAAGEDIQVGVAGVVVRCTRSVGDPGAIILSSDTVVYPDKTLNYPAALIRENMTGKPYARCEVFEDMNNGQYRLEPPEPLAHSGDDIGGGKPGTTLTLEAPSGYELTNIAAHCQKLDCDNPCAFVRGLHDFSWPVPKRRAQTFPTTDSCRVTVWMTGTKQKIVTGFQRQKQPVDLNLTYGRKFSVEFPREALDVKLYCDANGDQRIFSMSEIQKEGDQIYMRAVRDSATGRIIDLAVAPFELNY